MLASSKYYVVLASRSLPKVESAVAEILALKPQGTLSALQLDVTNLASIEAAAATVEKRFGRVDVVINNAGISGWCDTLQQSLSEALKVNAIGSALVAEAFRPLLLKSTNPYSIYVSSGAGSITRTLAQRPDPSQQIKDDVAYRVSKAAQNMVAAVEWRDYGPQGLKVFVMSPGCVVSNIRGESDEQKSAWGMARDADTAGVTVKAIIEGQRDADVGKFVVEEGTRPW